MAAVAVASADNIQAAAFVGSIVAAVALVVVVQGLDLILLVHPKVNWLDFQLTV